MANSVMDRVVITQTGTYNLRRNTAEIRIEAGPNAIVTVVAPALYSIQGLSGVVVSPGNFITLQQNVNTRVFYIIDGLVLHNSSPDLQGGAPGSYYHLSTPLAPKVITQNLIVGNNRIQHNLGATPRVITFWIAGLQQMFAPDLNFYGEPNYSFNVHASKAVTSVDIAITAF